MSDYLSFKEFLEEASAVKAGQPVAPPKRPRSPKAIVNVPHKRNKAAPKPIGKPLAPPEANTAAHKPAKVAKAVAESSDPKKAKPEKAVAIVVPQQSKLSKLLKHYSSSGGKGSAHKSGYAHARRGSISAPARTSSPKNFWGKKLED